MAAVRDTLDVVGHALAGVEHEPGVQIEVGDRRCTWRNRLMTCFWSVLDDLEVLLGQAGHDVPAPVGHGDAEVHQVRRGAEHRPWLLRG